MCDWFGMNQFFVYVGVLGQFLDVVVVIDVYEMFVVVIIGVLVLLYYVEDLEYDVVQFYELFVCVVQGFGIFGFQKFIDCFG